MQAVRAGLSQETVDHLTKKFAELLDHMDEQTDRGVDANAVAKGLRDEGGLREKDARQMAKALVASASLDDDRKHVCAEAFLHACANRSDGWHHWWRGDRIVKDNKAFDSSGGSGLLGAIADEHGRLQTEKVQSRFVEEDAKEERNLLAKMKKLKEKRERERAALREQLAPPREPEPLIEPTEGLTPRDSATKLPPVLRQLRDAVYSDDDLSPRSELLAGVRRFLYDLYERAERGEETEMGRRLRAGTATSLSLGVAVDARSDYLFGRAYDPGPPPKIYPPTAGSVFGEESDDDDDMKESPPSGRSWSSWCDVLEEHQQSEPAKRLAPRAAEVGTTRRYRQMELTKFLRRCGEPLDRATDEGGAAAASIGRLGGFRKGAMGSIEEGGGADESDAPPVDEKDGAFASFRDKMARDLVLVMAHEDDAASLPCPLKKLTKRLKLFGWPETLVWDGAVDDLKADGILYCSVDKENRPFEVYF